MERNHVITYLVVFLTVFVPFLVLRLFPVSYTHLTLPTIA